MSEENRDKDFASLMLSEPVLKGLKESGFVRPSPIQLAAIPNGKIGLDMIVQSKSGTGKTCVYVVTALEMIKSELPGLQVLVIAPTREIAMQGVEVASQIGSSLPDVKVCSFIGGMPVSEDRLKAQHCHMGIGTPGRLKQIFDERILNPDTVRLVILDEADKLLEDNFIKDTAHILNLLPSNKQFLALSATYPEELAVLAEKFMRSPQHIRLGKESQVLFGIQQYVMKLEGSPSQTKRNQIKQSAVLKVLSTVAYNQCLIFSNYQINAHSTADFLNSRGFPAIFISAGQDQLRRLQAIQTFKSFKCRVLCSTDLTARGIDAENVNLVINLDIPDDHNTYLHRIGRGGRFGSKSMAISLASEGKELKGMQKIVHKTGSDVRILPDVLPKNWNSDDFPLLDGVVEVVEESGEMLSVDPQEEKISQNIASKRNKIKRRGQKKGRPVGTRAKVSVQTNVSANLEKLCEVAFCQPGIFTETKTCEELSNLASKADWSASSCSLASVRDQVQAVGVTFNSLSEIRNREWETNLENCKRYLENKDLSELLELSKTGYDPHESRITLDNTEPTSLNAFNEFPAGNNDNDECDSSTTEDEESDSENESNESDGSVIRARRCSAPLDCLRVSGIQTEELKRWFRRVEEQRRLIQNREYWNIMHYGPGDNAKI